MKTKTSLSLSTDLLEAIDKLAGPGMSRSAIIERILRTFLSNQRRSARDTRDLRAINRHAERLNAEAADVLTYQESEAAGEPSAT